MSEEDFEELVELKAMQRRRHRQVVGGMIAAGIASTLGGLSIFAFSGGERPAFGGGAVGVVLIGVGIILIGRAAFSALTDYDTRPRQDLDPLAAVELDDDDDDDARPQQEPEGRREPEGQA